MDKAKYGGKICLIIHQIHGAKPLDLRRGFWYLYSCPPQYTRIRNSNAAKFCRVFSSHQGLFDLSILTILIGSSGNLETRYISIMLINNSANEIWAAALGELQLQINRTNYDTWLRDSVGLSYNGEQFVVGVASPFAVEYLEQRLSSLINKTLIGITGKELGLTFQVLQQDTPAKPKGHSKLPQQPSMLNHRKTAPTASTPNTPSIRSSSAAATV